MFYLWATSTVFSIDQLSNRIKFSEPQLTQPNRRSNTKEPSWALTAIGSIPSANNNFCSTYVKQTKRKKVNLLLPKERCPTICSALFVIHITIPSNKKVTVCNHTLGIAAKVGVAH